MGTEGNLGGGQGRILKSTNQVAVTKELVEVASSNNNNVTTTEMKKSILPKSAMKVVSAEHQKQPQSVDEKDTENNSMLSLIPTIREAQKRKRPLSRTKSMSNLGPVPEADVSRIKRRISRKTSMQDAEIKSVIGTESVVSYSNAPAKELSGVWNKFVDEGKKLLIVDPLIMELQSKPMFQNMSVLFLENHKLEKIFQYLQPCTNLTALYLKGNRVIIRDFQYIKHLTNLRKIDLSDNEIHFLPDEDRLQYLQKLEFLALEKNLIVGWGQLSKLACLNKLQLITLLGNPCAKMIGYRNYLVEIMPQLKCIDIFIVTDHERKKFTDKFPTDSIKRKRLRQMYRYRPFNEALITWNLKRFKISSKDINSPNKRESSQSPTTTKRKRKTIVRPQNNQSIKKISGIGTLSPRKARSADKQMININPASDASAYDMVMKTKDFKSITREKPINDYLDLKLLEMTRKFEYCSPVLAIQKTIKMFLTKRRFTMKKRKIEGFIYNLQKYFMRKIIQKWIFQIGCSGNFLSKLGKLRRIQQYWRMKKSKQMRESWFAFKMGSIYRMNTVQNYSLDLALGLQIFEKTSQSTKLYFKKSQISRILKIGLIRQAINMEDSEKFIVKKSAQNSSFINQLELRRSPLMNLVISSFRHTYVLNGQSLMKGKKLRNNLHNMDDLQDFLDTTPETAIPFVSKKVSSRTTNLNSQNNSSYVTTTESINTEGQKPKTSSKSLINDLNALIEVTFDSDFEVSNTLRAMASYNRRNQKVIQVFYGPFLHKMQAIICIQRWQRSIQSNKLHLPLFVRQADHKSFKLSQSSLLDRHISDENTRSSHLQLIKRVAKKIQLAFRNFQLKKRINSLINIAHYVSGINSNDIYLEQTTYKNLKEIVRNAKGAPWKNPSLKTAKAQSPPQKRGQNRTYRGRQRHHDTSFIERQFQFQVSRQAKFRVEICCERGSDKTNRYSKSNLPLWFQQIAKTEVPLFLQKDGQYEDSLTILSRNQILSLIHMQSNQVLLKNSSDEAPPKVLSLSEIRNFQENLGYNGNPKFIKISLPSIQEAKNRATVLALLTCNERKSADSFVRMYTKAELCSDSTTMRSFLLTHRVLEENSIKEDYQENSYLSTLQPSIVTEFQQHNGFLNKREEPILSILRTRRRPAQPKFERIIVLGDAEPLKVQQRLAKAVATNKVIYSKLSDQNTAYLLDGVNLHQSNSERTFERDNSLNLPAVQMRIISPREIAQEKARLQQNQAVIDKMNTFVGKLEQINFLVAKATAQDPGFRAIFLNQLIPMMQNQDQKEDWTDVTTKPLFPEFKLARNLVVKMPRVDGAPFPQNCQGLQQPPLSLEKQVERLASEYQINKNAYRNAVRKCQFKFRELTNISGGVDELQHVYSQNQRQPTVAEQNQYAYKIGEMHDAILESYKSDQSNGLQSDSINNWLQPLQALNHQKISNTHSGTQGQVNDFKKMVASHSAYSLRRGTLQKQSSRYLRIKHKKDQHSFTRQFVNQSNQIVNMTQVTKLGLRREAAIKEAQNTVMKVRLARNHDKVAKQVLSPSISKAEQKTITSMKIVRSPSNFIGKNSKNNDLMKELVDIGRNKFRQRNMRNSDPHSGVSSRGDPNLTRLLHTINQQKLDATVTLTRGREQSAQELSPNMSLHNIPCQIIQQHQLTPAISQPILESNAYSGNGFGVSQQTEAATKDGISISPQIPKPTRVYKIPLHHQQRKKKSKIESSSPISPLDDDDYSIQNSSPQQMLSRHQSNNDQMTTQYQYQKEEDQDTFREVSIRARTIQQEMESSQRAQEIAMNHLKGASQYLNQNTFKLSTSKSRQEPILMGKSPYAEKPLEKAMEIKMKDLLLIKTEASPLSKTLTRFSSTSLLVKQRKTTLEAVLLKRKKLGNEQTILAKSKLNQTTSADRDEVDDQDLKEEQYENVVNEGAISRNIRFQDFSQTQKNLEVKFNNDFQELSARYPQKDISFPMKERTAIAKNNSFYKVSSLAETTGRNQSQSGFLPTLKTSRNFHKFAPI